MFRFLSIAVLSSSNICHYGFFLTPFLDQIITVAEWKVDPKWIDQSISGNNVQQEPLPKFNRDVGLIDYSMTPYAFAWIVTSCILAFCVNLSIFLTIGYTSPISYNVLGHFKLCIITVGGIILFNEDANEEKLFGVVMALVGIIWYSVLKMNISEPWDKRTKKPTPNEDKELTEIESNNPKERSRNGHSGSTFKHVNILVNSSKN